MRAPLPLLLLAAVAAGCLAAEASPASYRFLHLDGDVSAPPGERASGACGFASTPAIDEAARTAAFPGEGPDAARTRILVAGVVWERVGCGVATTVWARHEAASGTLVLDVPGFGAMRFDVPEGGYARVDGHALTPGGLTLDAERTDGSRASLRIRDLGLWPSEGLSATERR